MEVAMRVSKWGNSLAIRLPAVVVDALDLKEGDEIEVNLRGPGRIDVDRKLPDDWLKRLEKFRGRLPEDFKFERDQVNAR
jgi:antitoxin MazE